MIRKPNTKKTTRLLLSHEEIGAVLSGLKTQDRTPISPQPTAYRADVRHEPKHESEYIDSYCSQNKTPINPRGMSDFWCWWTRDDRQGPDVAICPYGQPGDILWVPETWATGLSLDDHPAKTIAKKSTGAGYSKPWCPIEYLIDACRDNWDTIGDFGGSRGRFRQATQMPRWACRIFLEVTNVHVETVESVVEFVATFRRIGRPYGDLR